MHRQTPHLHKTGKSTSFEAHNEFRRFAVINPNNAAHAALLKKFAPANAGTLQRLIFNHVHNLSFMGSLTSL
jgi:hypothetical protein